MDIIKLTINNSF